METIATVKSPLLTMVRYQMISGQDNLTINRFVRFHKYLVYKCETTQVLKAFLDLLWV